MFKPVLVYGLCIVSSASLGWLLRSETFSNVSSDGVNSPALATHEGAARCWAASAAPDLEQIRTVVRDEVAAASRAQDGGHPAVSNTSADPGVASAEILSVRRDALLSIDTMIAGSQWGNEQRHELRQKLVLLDAKQAEQELQRLHLAISSGTLRIRTDGPPL